ncbi:bifunctional pantoate ligase/cytidylate kinase [Gloeomargarita lithophora Alchichica-D10]|uniref:Bifunctional pantoate ligase/cytidylate kinase n=1 Tax=Gloeomargarita lithophora Alchichica-D10 TaxID=1188229 RepID=A0A1J0ABB2_9CYAN|nr:bifunctional pantoate--beta-alanine ligase/(d)CMP kinase [Gloeomargarita lithophora]APB33224.1 bifunctional pantoate ligase/cytidylate kinase [Gloeomargarita lithophora Alchichica-D10]
MRLIHTLAGLQTALADREAVGFVPTMGALHPGHGALIRAARQEHRTVVVSIFVNPLQFAPGEDFAQYPRTLEADEALCASWGVDILFAPTVPELLGSAPLTQVVPPVTLTQNLCAPHRPGHFTGVATIVTLLLQMIRPHTLYLGQKDAQQVAILQRVIQDLRLGVQVRVVPTVREADGLALSSRNRYLNPAQRPQAGRIYQGLHRAETLFQQGERQAGVLVEAVAQELAQESALKIQYIELIHPPTLQPLTRIETEGLLAVAVFLGDVRLIDNVLLKSRLPVVAIDGPAGAGKSTVSRLVAQRLGLTYLDTGALYRAVTWAVLRSGVPLADAVGVAEVAASTPVELRWQPDLRVFVAGEDCTDIIRTPEVTQAVSQVAAQPAVRQVLLYIQRQYGQRGGIVVEGRDIGTTVFPTAELKIFLTASVQERAQRRWQELQQQGITGLDVAAIAQAIQKRDAQDSQRQVSPLRQAADAVVIDSDGLDVAGVVAQIVAVWQTRSQFQSQSAAQL